MASNSGQPGGNAPPAAVPPAAPVNRLTVAQIMNMTPPLQPGQAPWPQHEIVRYRNWYLQRDHPEHPQIGLTVEEIMNMTPPLQPGEALWTPYELARFRNWYLQRDHPEHPLINTRGISISDNPRSVPPPYNPQQQRQLPQPLQQPPYQSPYPPPHGGWF